MGVTPEKKYHGRGRPHGYIPKTYNKKQKPLTLLEEFEAQGFTRPFCVAKLKEIADKGGKDALTAIKLKLTLDGTIKPDGGDGATIVANAPVMVIMGATKDRMAALKRAMVPESPAILEEQRAARTNQKLLALKAGKSLAADRAQKRWEKRNGVEVLNVQSSTVEPDREAETRAGGYSDNQGCPDGECPGPAESAPAVLGSDGLLPSGSPGAEAPGPPEPARAD